MMREQWIDRTKNVACVLVVLGHFYTGLTEAGIAGQTAFYEWSHQTLYYFHVALFFLCSGYLYQKTAKVASVSAWANNVWKKLIALGVPYVVFSTATWLLKFFFASMVNAPVEEGLLHTLVAEPLSPYWYLYILFVIFAVTPTISGKRSAMVILSVAAGLKVISFLIPEMKLYAADKGMEYGIWFVLGMWAQYFRWPQMIRGKTFKMMGWVILAIFGLCSVLLSSAEIRCEAVAFCMGLLGCMAVLMILINTNDHPAAQRLTAFFSRYTMPVFLMPRCLLPVSGAFCCGPVSII